MPSRSSTHPAGDRWLCGQQAGRSPGLPGHRGAARCDALSRRDPERARHPVRGVPARTAKRRHHRVPPRAGAQGGRRQGTDHELLVPRCGLRRRWHRPVRDPRGHRDDRDQPLPDRRQRLRARRRRFGARLCAEAMGTEAVHRALVRFAQGELGTRTSARPTTWDSRTSTGPRSPRSASPWRNSASATGSRPRSPASSTSTPATRSPAASARRSTTSSHAERIPAQHAIAIRRVPRTMVDLSHPTRAVSKTDRCHGVCTRITQPKDYHDGESLNRG